jgi:hypothetical protein
LHGCIIAQHGVQLDYEPQKPSSMFCTEEVQQIGSIAEHTAQGRP